MTTLHLTVDVAEDDLRVLAAAIAALGAVTSPESYPPVTSSPEPPPAAAAPQPDPWQPAPAQAAPPPAAVPAAQPAPEARPLTAPRCQHGPMRYVPAGHSKATNRPYPAFWGCPGPRGSQCPTVPA